MEYGRLTVSQPGQKQICEDGSGVTLLAEECFNRMSNREQLSDVSCKARTALTFA